MQIGIRATQWLVLVLGAILLPQLAAAQEVADLDAYGELPGIEDMALSPSGDLTALSAIIDGQRTILVIDRAGEVRRTANAADLKFRGLTFAGDEHLLVYRSDTVDARGFAADQYELDQALVIPLQDGRDAWAVFADTRRLSNAVLGTYGVRRLADGWHGYFGAMEYKRERDSNLYIFDHGRPFLYDVALNDGDSKRLAGAATEGNWRDWLIAPDGTVAATLTKHRNNGDWSIRNGNGDEIASGRNFEGSTGLLGLGPEGATILYADEDPDGFERWFSVSLADGESTEFLEDVPVERIYRDSGTDRMLGYLEDAPDAKPVFFDSERQRKARMALAPFAGQQPRMVSWSDDMDRVIVHTQGNGDSGTWYLVDIANRSATDIGYDRPPIAGTMVGPVSTVEYTAEDGLALDGVLTLPPGREPSGLPVVVLPHGGPHLHDEIGFDWWAQAFASRGYAVFQPNFRGSTGRSAAFERAGFGQWGGKMQSDISDGLAFLAKQGIVDPGRACIMGASYGGYAALAGVTLQNGLYRCAVAVAGVSDIGLMYRDEVQAVDSRMFKASLETELGPRSQWGSISPRYQAERADAPILLIHGRDDTVVLYEQSLRMADALKDAGKPFRLVELEGEDHWLSLGETRKTMLREAMAFVQEHNPAD